MPEPEQTCETCGAVGKVFFVYALPGIPMSVGNCRDCFEQCAYPLGVAVANTEIIGGLGKANDWWKQSITYKDGRYLTVEEAFRPLGPDETCPECGAWGYRNDIGHEKGCSWS